VTMPERLFLRLDEDPTQPKHVRAQRSLDFQRTMRLLVHWVESGKVKLDDLITHDVNADQAAAMYDGLLNRRDEFLGVTIHW